MKTTVKAAIAISMSALWLSLAMGEEVSSDVAKDAARGWINLREALGEEITAEPESVLTYDAKDGKGKYYVVNLQGSGFVVTSGDTEIEPILAYSKEGTWNTNAAQNPIMVMLNIDVAAMTAELSSAAGWNCRRTAACGDSERATARWQGRQVGAAAGSEIIGGAETRRHLALLHQRRSREYASDDLLDTVREPRRKLLHAQ